MKRNDKSILKRTKNGNLASRMGWDGVGASAKWSLPTQVVPCRDRGKVTPDY